MKKEEKNQLVDRLAKKIAEAKHVYVADMSSLTVATTNELRRICFKRNIKLQVVKNTLLKRAMKQTDRNFEELFPALKGSSAIMLSEVGNVPARLIKEFRKANAKPMLKAAFVEESIYIGDNQLDVLVLIKSKNELIADVIALLQSPAKNVIGALQSSGNKLSGIVKTLAEKPE